MLSPLDEKYREQTKELDEIFSDFALTRMRVEVEIDYLIAFGAVLGVSIPGSIRSISDGFSDLDYDRVKEIERETRHDVKAVEYFIREKLVATDHSNLGWMVHFGLTSEDVNSIVLGKQLVAARALIVGASSEFISAVVSLARECGDVPMLARTHGQPALPTTMSKELVVHLSKLVDILVEMCGFGVGAKLGGAVGTLAAHRLAYPDVDWYLFGQDFVTDQGLIPSLATTQVAQMHRHQQLFGLLEQFCYLNRAFCRDMWWYISRDYFSQQVVADEVGSSTMPQKVNPIFLENAEGNVEIAAALFGAYARKLSYSRLQRDLSDSTVRRSFGEGFGHLLVGLVSMTNGVKRLSLNAGVMGEELQEHYEVLGEAIQVLLRKESVVDAYEQIKYVSRGDSWDEQTYRDVVASLDVSDEARHMLYALTPSTYLGYCEDIVRAGLEDIESTLSAIDEEVFGEA